MRWLLLTAFVVSAGLATVAGFREPEIQIDVDVGYALPELEDYNPPARRIWFGTLDIAARSERPCGSLSVVARRSPSSGYEHTEFMRLRSAGRRIRGSERYDVAAGQPYWIEVTAECRGGDGDGVRSTAHLTLRAGYRACEGSVRILSSKSPAARVGTTIKSGEALGVDRPVVVGAPECNGFHATLLTGSTRIGSYRPGGRGASFSGRAITVSRGDSHGGDFAIERTPLVVRPRGLRLCPQCALPRPSAYAVRSHGKRAVVRVYSGSVDVTGAAAPLRLREWHDGFFVCAGPQSCRLVAMRLVQPGDRLRIDPLPRPSLRFILPGQAAPLTEALAPPRAASTVTTVPAAGGEPRELVVQWYRETRREGERDARGESGVFVWQHVRGAWHLARRYYATRFEPHLRTHVGDVTGDGHRDVLVDRVTGGTGNCGTRIVFASLQGEIRRVYRQNFCEGRIAAEGGRLVQTLPVGPCPHRPGGVHCFGGSATTVLRLVGRRLVPVSRTIECALPRLDPRRNCA